MVLKDFVSSKLMDDSNMNQDLKFNVHFETLNLTKKQSIMDVKKYIALICEAKHTWYSHVCKFFM